MHTLLCKPSFIQLFFFRFIHINTSLAGFFILYCSVCITIAIVFYVLLIKI